MLPERAQRRLRREMPLRARPAARSAGCRGRARARAQRAARQGLSVCRGPTVEEAQRPARERVIFRATPGILAHFGPVQSTARRAWATMSSAASSRSSPAILLTRTRCARASASCTGLELFEFVNVEPLEDRTQMPPEVPVRVTRRRRQAPKVNFGVGYGTEEQARARIRWDHVNFFGGARHAGFEAHVVLARSRRAGSTTASRTSCIRTSHSTSRGRRGRPPSRSISSGQLAGRATSRHQADHRELLDRVAHQRVPAQRQSRRRRWHDFVVRDELIALGLDPGSGERAGTLSAPRVRHRPQHDQQPARRAPRIRPQRPRRTGGPLAVGFLQLLVGHGRGPPLPAGRARFVVANRLQRRLASSRRRRSTETCRSTSASSLAAHRASADGAASRSARSSGFGLPHRRLVDARGSARSGFRCGDDSARSRSSTTATSGRRRGLRSRRPALRRRPRPALPDADRPRAFDFGYQLNPIDNLLVNGEPQKRRWRIHFSIGQAF